MRTVCYQKIYKDELDLFLKTSAVPHFEPSENNTLLVLDERNHIAAAAHYALVSSSMAELLFFSVHCSYRHTDVSIRLLNALEKQWKQQQIKTIRFDKRAADKHTAVWLAKLLDLSSASQADADAIFMQISQINLSFQVSLLQEGRPAGSASLQSVKCYELLEQLQIPYQTVLFNFFPLTKEQSDLLDHTLNTPSIKNLIFASRNRQSMVMIVVPGDERFDLKSFRQKYHYPKLHMIPEAELNEILKTHQGSVGILCLLQDPRQKISLYIDQRILQQKYFRFHPCDPHVLVRISVSDLAEKLLPALHHEYSIIS